MSEMTSSLSTRRAHPCDQCSKAFSSTHQLAQHSRVHTGEKPYKCSYCDRKFKQLSHVQQHERLHTGERPYKCSAPNCGRTFIQLSNLQQHMKTHSSIDKIAKDTEKKFFCNECGKGFKGQSSLITHQNKKHSDLIDSLFLGKDTRNLAKYICQLCGKAYSNEASYTKHTETHQSRQVTSQNSSTSLANVQLFHCGICPSVFANEFALISHMEQMGSDPKHFEARLILSCATADKKPNTQSIQNTLANNISALVVNGIINNECDEASISANMIAQNLLQLNQTSSIEDSSHSPPENTGACTNGNANKQNHVADFSMNSKANSCKYYSKISEDSI